MAQYKGERMTRFLYYVFMAVLILCWLAVTPWAYADPDNDCEGNPHHCNGGGTVDVNASSITDVSTTVTHKSKALALGGGDVDIAQCYRSYSVLAGVWQDTKINPLCLADSYDAKGLHKLAAVVRCDVRAIRKHFDSDDECISANTMTAEIVLQVEPVVDESEAIEEQEYREEQREMYADLLAKIENMENARRAAARAAAQKEQRRQEVLQRAVQQIEEMP